MSLFMPTIMVQNVTDITVDIIKQLNVDTILLDVDNTLAEHGSHIPFEGTIEWTKLMLEAGFKIVIVSNNFENRVSSFAKKFDLPFVYLSLKPLPLGFNKAKKLLDSEPRKSVVIGDQVFTDILGANLAGMKSILLEPKACKETLGIKFRRILEKPIRKRAKNSKY